MKSLLAIFLLFSQLIMAIGFPNLATYSPKDAKAQTRGNWFVGLGFSHQLATNNFSCPESQCTQTDGGIKPDDAINLLGGELRLGRELSISSKISLLVNLEIIYSKNKDFSSIKPDDRSVDIAINQDSVLTSYFGYGASVGIALFPFKIKRFVILPVIEFGFNLGQSTKQINYFYNDIINVDEAYFEEHKQNYTLTKFGAGFNIIASSGIYSYFRVMATSYNFDSDVGKGYIGSQTAFNPNKIPSVAINSSTESPILVILGFGYRF